MNRRFSMRFPDGRNKALTFSYDDNVKQNARLVDLLDNYGMKGTFNLNSGLFTDTVKMNSNTMPVSQIIELFKDGTHEVALHGSTHPFLEQLSPAVCTYEVLKDREKLEQIFGCIIRGMAYPMGTYSDSVVDCLKSCGIAYSRTTKSTERFDLPVDWLRLPATCHHNNPRLMELAKKFTSSNHHPSYPSQLFYLWGHTYEFDNDNNWNVIEEFVEYMAQFRDEIWYATNIEIYEYMTDYSRLVFAVDGSLVHNPTNRTLWFYQNDKIYSINPGQTLQF